jgi:hypothetical protein
MMEVFNIFVFLSPLRPLTYEEFADLSLQPFPTTSLCPVSISAAVPITPTAAVAYPESVYPTGESHSSSNIHDHGVWWARSRLCVGPPRDGP